MQAGGLRRPNLAVALLCAVATLANAAPADDDARAMDEALPDPAAPAGSIDSRWHALIAAEAYQEAADLTQAWVHSTQKRTGNDDAALLVPLQRHAFTLEAQQRYAESRSVYARAVRLAETKLGAFAPELVELLTGLGRVLIAQGEFEHAEAPLLRAQGITHRNAGIFATSQDTILDHLTESYHEQGKIIRADQQQFFVLATFEKEHGDTPELVPALHEWARWNARLGRYAKVSDSLDRAVDIMQDAHGPNSLLLLETLELMIELHHDYPSPAHTRAGELAMRHMVDIYRSHPHADKADLLAAQTRLGDLYMLAESPRKGVRQYAATVASAADNGIDPELTERTFGDPKILYTNTSQPEFFGSGENDDAGEPGRIVIQFDVTKRGKTANIDVIEDTLGSPAITRSAIYRVNSSIYRPRFYNGKAVVTRAMQQLFEVRRGGKGLILSASQAPQETQSR